MYPLVPRPCCGKSGVNVESFLFWNKSMGRTWPRLSIGILA